MVAGGQGHPLADGALRPLDLRRGFGGVAALDGVTFTAPASQVFGLLIAVGVSGP